ncbi:hypothetical protein KO527_14245 [Pseudoalteromonas sp. C2R02]|uniref:DUF5666 domain-containing protein n=1 Tax=Pseudoalteromonas sp. C2R02 TaxID=2841565 RepID=UPI001C0956DD|nr:DUF5666 domain-containing protein [Pseudoalteromonas sp. C2R02]MBU2970511.1 hypothetical protein [Pseudoalteromonas sp. C2R02]
MKRSLLIILLFLISSCGGSSGTKEQPIIEPVLTAGILNLTVLGLPDGQSANITITGPNGYTQTISDSIKLTDLDVGSYSATVNDVTISGVNYQGFDTSISFTLSDNITLDTEVIYGALTQSQGVISGFGSVFVNGTRFNTDNSIITTDLTATGSDSDLDIGMNVSIVGLISADGTMAKANKVDYSAIVRGPVEEVNLLTREITVLGQVILTDESTEFKDTDFESLVPGDIVGVSAILNPDDILLATLIKKLDDTDSVFIVRGEMSDLNADLMTFKLDSLTIDYTSAEVEGELVNGESVKVISELAPDDNTLVASKVEVKNIEFDQGSMIALDGIITEIIDIDDLKFKVNNQIVIVSDITTLENGELSDIVLHKRVKVFGQLNEDNVLTLTKIRFDKPGIIKVNGPVDSTDGTTAITVLGINFISDKHTHFIDKSALKVKHFGLSDIEIHDRVQIKAFEKDTQFIIRQLKRVSPEDSLVKLEGALTNITETTFEVQGIVVQTTELTKFEYWDDVSQAEFFALIQDNDEVEVKGMEQEDSSILALKVEYEEDDQDSNKVELKGTVDASFETSAEFTVNGHLIVTNEATEYKDGSESDLAPGIKVEIKGQQGESGAILALKIEFDSDDDESEIEGVIETFSTIQEFTIGEFTINTDDNTEFKYGTKDDLAQGVNVEVKGNLTDSHTILAIKIEFKHDEDHEVEGVIVNSEFSENLQFPFIFNLEINSSDTLSISVSQDTEFKDGSISMLANGVNIEVEGHFNNNMLVAQKIKFEKVEYEGILSDFVSEFNFKVDGHSVTTNEFTDFKGGTVNDLANGIEVKVKGSLNSNGILVATKLEFDD